VEINAAYFTAEFGIDETLSIYSGGLGILAGDYLKSAHDLGLPIVGISILYRRGYFFQHILEQGEQVELYPELNINEAPLAPALDHNGNPIVVGVPIAGRTVLLKVWHVKIGNIPIYLLDADLEHNTPEDRALTDHLYGGNQETRIAQEIILGIGGVRAIRKLGIAPNVWHLNEGHAAFSSLERIREYSAEGVPFSHAVDRVKPATIFTTHTPVPAGHDRFDLHMIDEYLGDFYWQMGASRDQVMALGVVDEQFNMTRLAVSTAWKINGVSDLHTKVTHDLLNRWLPEANGQFSLIGITNGVHAATWVSKELKSLLNHHLGHHWIDEINKQHTWKNFDFIPDESLWETHQTAKRRLLNEYSLDLQEDVLLIGFARRFATYKRANLIFQDLERLSELVNHADRPVAFVFAGKAHPADKPGQLLLQEIVEASKLQQLKHRIFFLQNYDMAMSSLLVQGVDVWLNTPVKFMEASGTSGQKAALNGVINCSVLDGWWAEGYNGENGWAIDSDPSLPFEEMNRVDSSALYHLLEHEIIPLYYQKNDRQLPTNWIHLMKTCIRTLAPQYNTHRMVFDYVDQLYVPTLENQDI
jgi:starch phosphorylase